MVLEHDWGTTALGPQADWSPTLRTAVSTALNSRFPFLLMWGPELVMVYNDGYAPMLGARHPSALGRSARDVWSDIWGALDPMVAEVMAGRATYSEDLPLVMTRHGYEEETYFSFSFSPVVEPGGQVVGLLDTVVETTHRVLAARRLSVLQRLGSLPRAAHGDTTEAVGTALGILADARNDCPFGIVYLADEDGEGLRLVAAQGVGVQGELATGPIPEQVRRAMATEEARTVTGLATLVPGLSTAGAGSAGQADVDTAVVLPLTSAGAQRPAGALVMGASPHLPLDEDYRIFMALAAGQVAATVTDAQAVAAERRRAEERAQSERARAQFFTDVAVTLQRAVLGPTVLPEGFAVHYEPATGTLEVGGDWYDVVDLPDGGYGVVVGDVVGRGLPAAAVMGQLRSAGRALLLESRSPAHVLSALDRFAALVPGAAVSTVFCAVIDPRTGTVRYSGAGHPPAILVAADGTARQLQEGCALPLAVVDGCKRPEAEVEMPAGSTLLLYTDGLIERRDEALDEGLARATAALVEGRHLGPAELSALLTERLLDDAPDDDVAFVLFRCG
ncbi:MAG TPA: SpoIIE family protein phosphatase [Blastococcus sp.]|nr:SpoIIE family protein phosphatase [Blastococcus sp.]